MRKTKQVTIDGPSDSRDVGKTFLITEMSATAADAWAMKAMGAMARSGTDIPADFMRSGLQGFTLIGLKALMAAPYSDTAPLFAELMSCVQIIEPSVTRPLLETDIEEIATITRLRDEVIQVHANFSPLAVLLAAMTVLTEPMTGAENS